MGLSQTKLESSGAEGTFHPINIFGSSHFVFKALKILLKISFTLKPKFRGFLY